MKVLRILIILILVAGLLFFVAKYAIDYYKSENKEPAEISVSINRHYQNDTEKKLIDLAENTECDLSNADTSSVWGANNLEAVCISKEDIDSYLSKEKELIKNNDRSSNYVIDYNARVNRDKGWGEGMDSWEKLVLDKNGNNSSIEKCLNLANEKYWLVLQRTKTSFGRPDKLAGSGATKERYLMFDSNFNLICQSLSNSSWIN